MVSGIEVEGYRLECLQTAVSGLDVTLPMA